MSLQTYLGANPEFMTGKVGLYPEESRTLVGVKSERAKALKKGALRAFKVLMNIIYTNTIIPRLLTRD